jgi:arylsulfatase A-like enzyme
MIHRRRAIALACAAILACGGGRRARPGIPPRTVLLVTVDGLRADHVSAWTYARPTTWIESDAETREAGRALAIDDLAEEGVVFARAFAPSTEALESLAALHTGRSPLETGVGRAGDLSSEEETLAEVFSAAGFQTVAFVARRTGDLAPGWKQGFERFERTDDDSEAVRRARAWIDERDFGSGARSFVWLHLEGPTLPHEPGTRDGIDYRSLFADRGEAAGDDAALYDGEIAELSHLLRDFFDHLHETGGPADAWGGTLLAFVGLGGGELEDGSAPDPRARARPAEGVLHVPLFLRHTDSLTGRRIFRALVTLEDLRATLLEWFELPVPAASHGRSLLSLTDEWRKRAFPSRPLVAIGASDGEERPACSVRNDRWRLVVWPAQSSTDGASEVCELYDLEDDARGKSNVASEHPDTVRELREILSAQVATLALASRFATAGWPR